jgi:hypothetical protein
VETKARSEQKLCLNRHNGNYASYASKNFHTKKLASNCVLQKSFADFGQKKFPKTSLSNYKKNPKFFED